MDEPWLAPLREGRPEVAWDAFIERYRRLVFASIRHHAQDYDDVMEIFARVCEALREDDLRRLRHWAASDDHSARFSTWLVTVVHHLTIDWFRARDGRRRLPAVAEGLPPLERRMFEHVFVEGRSHAETYELLRMREAPSLSFRGFLAALRGLYATVTTARRGRLLPMMGQRPAPSLEEPDAPEDDAPERAAALERGLAGLAPQDRLVLELYVMEELPAAEVARIVGLPGPKAVYNRAYRALAQVRERLSAHGIQRGDL